MQKQTIVGDFKDTKETHSIDVPRCMHRLSNSERCWLWDLMSNVSVTARIVGDVDEKNLLHAINAARQMHPLLSARVVFDDQYDAWFSTDNALKTIFRTVPRGSDTQWINEIQQEHLIPFEPEIGHLIRFVLVYSDLVSELIIFAHHSICDGISLANLIRDILVFYTEPAKEVQIIPPLLEADYLPNYEHDSLSKPPEMAVLQTYNKYKTKYSNSLLNLTLTKWYFVPNNFLRNMLLQKNRQNQHTAAEIDSVNICNLLWRKSPHYFTQADFNEVHKAYWEKHRYNVVLLQLDSEETSILTNKCRDKGVTITSATTIAYLAAYRDVFGSFPNRCSVWIPYDLRRHLGEDVGDIFCFFVKSVCPKFDYNTEKTFWENSQEIHGAIRKGLEQLDTVNHEMIYLDPILLDAISFALSTKLVPKAFERTKNLSAFAHDTKNIVFMLSVVRDVINPIIVNTNLGRLDFPETYGNLRLDNIFFVPPVSITFPYPLMFGGVGFNGKLVFTLNYVEQVGEGSAYIREQDMIRIRNRSLEYLGFPEKVSDKAY